VGTISPVRVLETIFGTSGVVAKTLSRRAGQAELLSRASNERFNVSGFQRNARRMGKGTPKMPLAQYNPR